MKSVLLSLFLFLSYVYITMQVFWERWKHSCSGAADIFAPPWDHFHGGKSTIPYGKRDDFVCRVCYWFKLWLVPKLVPSLLGSCSWSWAHGMELIGGKQQSQVSPHGFGRLHTLLNWSSNSLFFSSSLIAWWVPWEGAAASFKEPQHSTLLNSGMFEWK